MAPRIAVVAVHGVADQPEHDSARHMAELLCRLTDPVDGRPCYDQFEARGLAMPVRPLDPGAGDTMRALFAAPSTGLPDQAFSREQLQQFELPGDEAVYETIALLSTRRHRDGSEAASVHLYEMYWADLSRLSADWLRILGELYQLLLHLGSLARHVAEGVAMRRTGWVATAFRFMVDWAAIFLSVPIAILNLALVVAAILVLGEIGRAHV